MPTRFWGVRLAPGVTRPNMAAFYAACLVGLAAFTFIAVAQSTLLEEATHTIAAAQTRTDVMTRRLTAVESLPEPRTRQLLPLADTEDAAGG